MRLMRLPGWIVDNTTSVHQEVTSMVGASMAERWEATRRCCQAASAILGFNRDAAAARNYRDPLPESAQVALVRLRKAL